MADIEIEIDGKKLTAKPDQTIIQVADAAGIYIPRFCYHKHLTVAANCRMCLVEVEKSPKTLPACATPVMAGMKVFTKSAKTIEAQRAVMEFLLINHPLDCPICDQGGECELQDLSMGYGSDQSEYDECKRSVADQNIGPLIATEMTRCIYCTRCVRFGDEVAGMRELGGTFRGGDTEIGTYVQHAIHSEVSGNIIDLCPVGALTSKPYRFTARAWELDQKPGISPHDCLGSSLNIHTRYGKVMRVVSRENNALNETWLSDRDRFSYTGLYHADRLEQPKIRIDGELKTVEWGRALEAAAVGLQDVIAQNGSDKLGALASPNSSIEEFYLLQKIIHGLGSPHIDYRLRETDTRDQHAFGAFPKINFTLEELVASDAIVLIGSNLQKEVPLIATRVRKAALKGSTVVAINPVDYHFNFKVTAKKIIAPKQMVRELKDLIKALETNQINESQQAVVQALQGKTNGYILLGALALHHPQAAEIRALAQKLAEKLGSKLGILTDGTNSAGAWIAGAIPHRHAGGLVLNEPGLSAYEMLEKPRRGYLLLNVEPAMDCANAAQAVEAFKHAEFIVALSAYSDPVLEAYADVILPIGPFTETSGTYINVFGDWQSFQGVANAYGASRPAWKVLRVLGNFLHLDGFGYESSEEIKHEVKAIADNTPAMKVSFTQTTEHETHTSGLSRIGEIPIYAVDSLVRRAQPLQAAQSIMEGELNAVRLHPDTAKHLSLQAGDLARVRQGNNEIELPVMLDERIAKEAAWIAGGIAATAKLGNLFGDVLIERK